MPWDKWPQKTIPFKEPQPFGCWETSADSICFHFYPNYNEEAWLKFESDQPITLILEEKVNVKIIEHLSEAMYQLHTGAQLMHRDLGLSHKLHFSLDAQAQLIHITSAKVSTKTNIHRSFSVQLAQPKASVQWEEAVWIYPSSKYTEYLSIEHQAEHTHSNYILKSVVEEQSELRMSCDVTIQKEATYATAHQKNLNYILGPHGHVTAQPRLHILNRKIEASHGTATQPVPQEALFYLQSRGLSLSEARHLFLKSFLGTWDEGE